MASPSSGLPLATVRVMGIAEMNFLNPLFDLARSLTSDEGSGDSFGLGGVEAGSSLSGDNRGTGGYWVSHSVTSSINAAVDQALTLEMLVRREEATITISAPWTLIRSAIETSSAALWVLDGNSRNVRQERALRMWHTDMEERDKWEKETGYSPTGRARTGRQRMTQIEGIAVDLGLRPAQINTRFNYSDVVEAAGRTIGLAPGIARARWREASGFAHGRVWPMLRLTTPEGAERSGDGAVNLALTFDENRLRDAAGLVMKVLNEAVLRYAEAARTES